MKLYVKNMVCDRCKMAVKSVLEKHHLAPLTIELGEITLPEDKLDKQQLANLSQSLNEIGFELIDDRKSRLIEKIKNTVIGLIHYLEEQPEIKYSDYIAGKLHHEYTYLSKLFSEIEGITIEQYIIKQKIEKVKELLVYDELSLSEIAYKLGYSSVAHLSAQFKKITGLTPSFYKNKGIHQRTPLDKIK